MPCPGQLQPICQNIVLTTRVFWVCARNHWAVLLETPVFQLMHQLKFPIWKLMTMEFVEGKATAMGLKIFSTVKVKVFYQKRIIFLQPELLQLLPLPHQ